MAKASRNLSAFVFKQTIQIFLGLLIFIIIPFSALRLWMPDIPHMHYYFLGILFVLKIMIFQDSIYAKEVERKLPKLIGSNSKNQIFQTGQLLVNIRNGLLVLTGLTVFILNFAL